MPEHLWFLRRIRIDVVEPFLEDQRGRPRHLVQRAGGDRRRTALVAPGRQRRPRRGRQRLDPSRPGSAAGQDRGLRDLRRRRRRPAGLDEAGAARSAARTTAGLPWPLRVSDIDLHGHVNNAVYWQAVEHVLPSAGVDPARPLVAELDYREPIDLGDEIELVARRRGGARWSWAFARRTGSGPWRGWRLDSVAPGGALCLLVEPAPCLRLIVRSSTPSRSHVTRLTCPERTCGWRMIRAAARGTGSRGEDRVGELLVLVAELDSLRVPVQLRAGEPDSEVAPVVRRERARKVVRAGRDGVAACADHRGAGGEDPGGSPPASPAR